ncbi:autotransporter-associated N-terminal domain-containing protein, partial [Leptotrichia wadei]|uniref:autotransporter-associated N-terminal domain-containing protein n=1 Tax=Leptotrichia wadei TaxID=157687 RepID=UPI0028D1DB04
MTNNLRKAKKDLCAFAKKCKDFKYTDSALITFLITGVVNISNNLFSAETNKNIDNQKQAIHTSIKDIHQEVQKTREENNKLLKKTNLELIQLMEQGDHVVKSPWSSWQYGINGFYNNWGGTYKGRGDKSEKYPYEGKFERSQNRFERNISPLSPNYDLLSKSRNPRSATTSGRFGYEKGYGISSTEKKQEPVGTLNIDASIKPKEIHKYAIAAPNISVSAPALNPLTIPAVVPPTLTIPKPNPPKVNVKLPAPNADPFVDFSYQNGVIIQGLQKSRKSDYNVIYSPTATPGSWFSDGGNHEFWLGYKPTSATTGTLVPEYGVDNNRNTNGYGINNVWLTPTPIPTNQRIGALFYYKTNTNVSGRPDSEAAFSIKNMKLHLAGNIGSSGKSYGNSSYPEKEGALGIHGVWNGELSNIEANLYGKAAFLSLETWHAGKIKFDETNGIKVNITKANLTETGAGDNNTIFFIYPGTYDRIKRENTTAGATKQRGGFVGKVDADIKTNKNIVYSVLGVQGSYEIDSKGTYNITGNENIVYSGYGYVPNWNNLLGTGTKVVEDKLKTGMTPSIKLTVAPIVNGNNNVVLLFNSMMPKAQSEDINVYDKRNQPQVDLWQSTPVGIYQGEILAKAQIGTTELTPGSMAEGNVGIYSRSGQRGEDTKLGAKIVPSSDLGATDTDIKYDNDAIHSLQINNIDINFGKYSKNGVMIAAERGTVIDVAKDSNSHSTEVKDKNGVNVTTGEIDNTTVKIMSKTDVIKDYAGTAPLKVSYDDSKNEVATGTTIAYASGKWDHEFPSSSAQNFTGQGSQINIGRNVVMTARYKDYTPAGSTTKVESFPVAYVAKDSGIVTAAGTTDAKGFGSIIAYADNNAKITLDKAVTAVDEWAASDDATKPYLYKNIGGYANKGADGGSTITFGDDVKVHGIGGFSNGAGSVIKFEGTNNEIYSAKEGGLIALDGGKIDFKGGKIDTRKRNPDDDYSGVVPFLADAGSNINFSGHTDVTISDGILMPGTAADYDGNDVSIAPAGKKYTGMGNMDVTVDGTGVILRITEGGTTADNKWTGPGGLLTGIKNDMHLNKLTVNPGADYKVFYKDGQYSIEQSIDLDNATEFDRIKFLNEKIFIAPSTSITSTSGKGMIVGSYDSSNAPSNASTGYVNNGTVDISGGKASTTALSTSYGSIENNSSIKLDKGVAVYGINGSKLVNETKGTIELSDKGVGMAAFTSGNNLQSYGTDKKIAAGTLGSTEKTLEIENKGLIKSNANGSVGIYGELNTVTGAHPSIEVGKAGTSHGSIRNAGK